jgi:hypothetical protein
MNDFAKALKFYRNRPVEFVEDFIGVKPDTVQSEILRSVAENQMTTVRSGHGIGKSSVEAWAIIWFMSTRPFPKIPCTAPTQHQLFDILWAEVNKWLRHNPLLAKEFVWTHEKLYIKGYPEEWFAVARTATKPDALQGFHAQHVLYIIDEASGVSDSIFEPVLGSLSTEGAKLLMCGNPTNLTGFFYDSHHKNSNVYSTFHIDGRQSERVSKEFVSTIKNMYGEDSDVFRVRVAGEFPLAENDVFIPLSLIEKSIQHGEDYEPPNPPTLIHIGCDVARFGDDKTVIGYKIDNKIYFEEKTRKQDTMTTADHIIQLAERLRVENNFTGVIPVKIDDGGVGGGVVDRLKQIQKNSPQRFADLEIIAVKFGQRIKHKHYHDSTSYMLSVVKKLIMEYDADGIKKPVELFLPNDNDLSAQLSCRRYKLTESSKIQVESKDSMKKRGHPSPDEADCVLLLCLPVKTKK